MVWQNDPMPQDETRALEKAIERLHGCRSWWLRAEPVIETFQGKTVWEGDVQVFTLLGHPEAKMCYAWSYQTEKGKQRFAAVLHHQGVDSPLKAVQAAIASGQP